MRELVELGLLEDSGRRRPAREIKFWDKLRALELLAKLKGLLKPEVKVEAGDSWKAVLQRMHAEDQEQGADDA